LEILTWTQDQEPIIGPLDLYDTLFTDNPVEGFVIFTEPGIGKFEGTVRFRNPNTDFCVNTLVSTVEMEAFLVDMRPCDPEAEVQVRSEITHAA
jgi:hypothetical protein